MGIVGEPKEKGKEKIMNLTKIAGLVLLAFAALFVIPATGYSSPTIDFGLESDSLFNKRTLSQDKVFSCPNKSQKIDLSKQFERKME